MHLAIGHYAIGSSDGVNTVIWRTVTELQRIDPNMRITLFGKTTPGIEKFLPWKAGKLTYRNIEEISPEYHIPGLESKSIQLQRAHDYIWHGTNVSELLQQQLADADVVLVENLSVGLNPAVTYAFYLWSLWEYQAHSHKRFLVRVHDFVQHRPTNFSNIKKFQSYMPMDMPDWHQVMYPSTPNVEYIPINTNDYYRLLEHGVDPKRVWYVPNSIDNSLVCNEIANNCTCRGGEQSDKTRKSLELQNLRELLEKRKGISPEEEIIFYPVRAIPRKNVEEAIFLTQLLNNLSKMPDFRDKYNLKGNYHLVVSLGGSSDEEKAYAQTLKDFARENNLPVTIDISDLVALHREYDPENPDTILKYGVVDMYDISRMTVSTSLMEGFGFVFIEPWAAGQCIIGRNIPSVTMDFVKTGLSLDHLYSVLLVNGTDYADLGLDQPDHGLAMRLAEINKLNDPEYVRMIINRNSASLRATLRLFRTERRRNPRRNLIKSNCKKVVENYSSREVVGLLYRIITRQEDIYINPHPGVKRANRVIEMDNGKIANMSLG